MNIEDLVIQFIDGDVVIFDEYDDIVASFPVTKLFHATQIDNALGAIFTPVYLSDHTVKEE